MAIRITRVYTRTGDRGETRLVGGRKVPKDALRVEAYGTIDELNATLGLARTFNEAEIERSPAARRLDAILKSLQNELFDLGSEVATPAGGAPKGMYRVGAKEVAALERRIDDCQRDLKPLSSFILPGGGRVAAFLHQARTVCRRAERELVRLSRHEPVGEWAIRYINRFGDLLFVLARWIGLHLGEPEYLWERGLRLGTARRSRPRRTR
jgi:cob(I)alamin adenosyltransferase